MMDHPHEPIDAIKTWQDWYKSHRMVAQLDTPLITKDSRETMHDTTQATNTFKETDTKAIWMQKAKEHFADTLAEYQYELSGKDFYKAFYQAAYEYLEATKKEYERTKELVDLLRYKELGQD